MNSEPLARYGILSRPNASAALPGLSFVNVSKRYGALEALSDLSLDIRAGQFVALLGPSGCGKTTLLNIVAGFISPDGGDVLINGQTTRGVPSHQRNVGVVFQDYALFPHMTVFENLAFPLEVRGTSNPAISVKVRAALDLVRLGGMSSRRVDQLSGGQRQRVALARALIYEPPLLLLDEPFGALDRRLRDSMQLELKALHSRLGITFVFVTHDQDEAMAMADVVVVMRNGRIEQCGTPVELYDRPRTPFVATFLGDCNVIQGQVTKDGIRHAASGALLHAQQYVDDDTLGQAKSIAIRPEWIGVLQSNEAVRAEHGAIDGRVVQFRFLGREVVVEIDCPLGTLLVRIARSGGEQAPEVNRSLRLVWDARSTVPLEEDRS